MRYFLISALTAFLAILVPSTIMADDMLVENFALQPEARWRFFTDGVMGGVSNGQVDFVREGDHIHTHMNEMVSVDDLAQLANMSTSGFRKSFREVMHMPPLQYAKSIKLNRAQLLIREGKNASEAGHLVGYNSPAQFSREYKRYFGFSPSAT